MPMQARASSRRWIVCAPMVLSLAACSLGPAYRHPDVPLPAAWSTPSAQSEAAAPPNDWWRGFGSEALNGYIAQAQGANDDIGAAMARVLQADAQARIVGAALLPSLSGNFGAERERAPSSPAGRSGSSMCTARACRPATSWISGAEIVICSMRRWRPRRPVATTAKPWS